MKDVKLIRLSLRNFKGMTYDLVLNGSSADIYGRNKTGKTTTADALCFLITGKNSRGQAKFDIKTKHPDGTTESRMEHEVMGILDDNGLTVELRCVHHEVWKNTRGSATQEMAGNTTDYYVDGVSVSETAYRARISEIFGDAQTFSLVSNPMYFIDLAAEKWEAARALVMRHFSTLTDAQVFDSSPDLLELRTILTEKRRTAEQHKTVVAAEQKRISDQITAIPIRIDEVKRSLPGVTGLDRMAIEADMPRVSKSVADAALRLSGVDTGSGIAELSKRLAGINADIQKMETAHYTETMKAVNRLNAQISEEMSKENDVKRRIGSIGADLKTKESRLKAVVAEREAMIAKWTAIDAEAFQDTTADACAACGQALPADRVQAARDKALAAFNASRAERLADNERRGKQLAEDRDTLAAEISELTKERENLEAGIPEHAERLQKMTAERDTVRALAEDYTVLGPHHEDLLAQKTEVESAITTARTGTSQASDKARAELKYLEDVLAAAKADVDKFVRREAGEKRIEDLKAEEKKLAAEFERLEKQRFLCEKFIQEQARQMSDEINAHFRLAKFVLFETQINGGIKPTCLITEGGNIAGRGLNTGTTLNVGVDICQAFSRALGIRTPIVIDNAESVTDWIDTDQQIIRFHAKVDEPALRVELQGDRQAVAA